MTYNHSEWGTTGLQSAETYEVYVYLETYLTLVYPLQTPAPANGSLVG